MKVQRIASRKASSMWGESTTRETEFTSNRGIGEWEGGGFVRAIFWLLLCPPHALYYTSLINHMYINKIKVGIPM